MRRIKTAGGRCLPPSSKVLRGDYADGVKLRLFLLSEEKPTGCIEFTGRKKDTGYGQIRFLGSVWGAHRVAYAIKTGRWPGKWHVRHVCNNPACINPDHLRRGTKDQNEKDKQKNKYRPWNWKNQYGQGI